MTDTLAYHVGSNVPGYMPESDVTCWDTVVEAREALLTLMFAHVDHLGDMCDCDDVDPECDECDTYAEARRITENTAADTSGAAGADWREGVTVHLSTGRALPLAFWIESLTMDHAAECEPLSD